MGFDTGLLRLAVPVTAQGNFLHQQPLHGGQNAKSVASSFETQREAAVSSSHVSQQYQAA